MNFSSATKEILRKGGWTEARNVSTRGWLSILSERGFPTFPALEAFLQKFGGLHLVVQINISITKREKMLNKHFHFNPVEDIYSSYREEFEAFSEILAAPLCPIGVYNTMPLLMDEAGQVYFTFDGELYELADSGEEAIEKICTHITEAKLVAEVEIPA